MYKKIPAFWDWFDIDIFVFLLVLILFSTFKAQLFVFKANLPSIAFITHYEL